MGTVLVTGASDGIGHATAKALFQRGDTVLVHGRTEANAAAAAKAMGRGASAVWAELGDFRQISPARGPAGRGALGAV